MTEGMGFYHHASIIVAADPQLYRHPNRMVTGKLIRLQTSLSCSPAVLMYWWMCINTPVSSWTYRRKMFYEYTHKNIYSLFAWMFASKRKKWGFMHQVFEDAGVKSEVAHAISSVLIVPLYIHKRNSFMRIDFKWPIYTITTSTVVICREIKFITQKEKINNTITDNNSPQNLAAEETCVASHIVRAVVYLTA